MVLFSRWALMAVLVIVSLQLYFAVTTTSPSHSSRALAANQNLNRGNDTTSTCAPWIQENDRKVLFYGMPTWDKFYRKLSIKGGEHYVFASLDYALEQNGFTVEMTDQSLDKFSIEELSSYHRIYMNGIKSFQVFQDHPEIFCKVRAQHFFGNWQKNEENPQEALFDPRQIISPYPEDYNTFSGFFVHSLLYNDPPPKLARSKQALIVGKVGRLFQSEHKTLMEALIAEGYTLHSVCHDGLLNHCGMPPEVIIHPFMQPKDYADLMSEMAFLIGFGDPIVSPSPFEGLAHGAAWLNPIRSNKERTMKALHDTSKPLRWTSPTPLNTQHNPLALLGVPYVYNIDLSKVANVVEAANWATRYRFSSFTPAEYRPEAMIARTCSMLEDNAICLCQGTDVGGPDCRRSSYIRNMPIG